MTKKPAAQPRMKNKFHARKTPCSVPAHGLHDSKAEAAYCVRLELMRRGGEILKFETQVEFQLPGGPWKADFLVAFPDGRLEVHEVKGVVHQDFRRIRREWKVTMPNLPLRVFRRVGRGRRAQWVEIQ